jgi:hypothetical protein
MRLNIFLIGAITAFFWACAGMAQEQKVPAQMPSGGDCTPCHDSDTPSKDDLLPNRRCMRIREKTAPTMKEGQTIPDVVLMDEMSQMYTPVVFPHGLHAKMETLSEGCGLCHHHSEKGKIVSCKNCHDPNSTSEDLRQPSLKGAYHRQCMACHREWSETTDCQICHAKRTKDTVVTKPDLTDITGQLHPNVSVPELKVYPTNALQEGTMVTFRHKEHIEVFGKQCAECHRNENCSRCHDPVNLGKHKRKDPHEDCQSCHDVANGDCTECHMERQAPPFTHSKRAKFALKPYHLGIACKECHKDTKQYAGLKSDCRSCHAENWFPTGFDHAKTSLTLNEAHKDTDCLGCHPKGLGVPTDCTVCHDDKQFPKDVPGVIAPPAAPVAAPATSSQATADAVPVTPPPTDVPPVTASAEKEKDKK